MLQFIQILVQLSKKFRKINFLRPFYLLTPYFAIDFVNYYYSKNFYCMKAVVFVFGLVSRFFCWFLSFSFSFLQKLVKLGFDLRDHLQTQAEDQRPCLVYADLSASNINLDFAQPSLDAVARKLFKLFNDFVFLAKGKESDWDRAMSELRRAREQAAAAAAARAQAAAAAEAARAQAERERADAESERQWQAARQQEARDQHERELESCRRLARSLERDASIPRCREKLFYDYQMRGISFEIGDPLTAQDREDGWTQEERDVFRAALSPELRQAYKEWLVDHPLASPEQTAAYLASDSEDSEDSDTDSSYIPDYVDSLPADLQSPWREAYFTYSFADGSEDERLRVFQQWHEYGESLEIGTPPPAPDRLLGIDQREADAFRAAIPAELRQAYREWLVDHPLPNPEAFNVEDFEEGFPVLYLRGRGRKDREVVALNSSVSPELSSMPASEVAMSAEVPGSVVANSSSNAEFIPLSSEEGSSAPGNDNPISEIFGEIAMVGVAGLAGAASIAVLSMLGVDPETVASSLTEMSDGLSILPSADALTPLSESFSGSQVLAEAGIADTPLLASADAEVAALPALEDSDSDAVNPAKRRRL